MSDLVKMTVDDNSISFFFNAGEPKIMDIGTKMNMPLMAKEFLGMTEKGIMSLFRI